MAAQANRKKAVNLSIDAALVAEAKEAGTNLSAVLEAALNEQLREKRRKKWLEDNREAIEAGNAQLERDGMWYTPDWLKE
ncbi:MAG: type II toxin-antitoxin system CcdA family antitoxin [Hyphomicrobiaceae bacterium]|nr:type II toxin-antitoxin system CcdA family antitoxin [Hyphomicrobiaceae bacterium]